MKLCKTCNIEKSLDSFNKATKTKDGLYYRCRECDSLHRRNIYKSSPDLQKSYQSRSKTRYHNDKVGVTESNERWRKANLDKRNATSRKWRKENREWRSEEAAARRAKTLQAAVGYNFFKKEIKLIYKNRPKGLEVDHIIPLAGKEVCGLHVPWNLQYLSPEENRKKSNKVKL